MSTATVVNQKPFSLHELRALLWDDIHGLRAGKVTAASLNATSNASGKIMGSVKLELEIVKTLGRKVSNVTALLSAAGLEEDAPCACEDASTADTPPAPIPAPAARRHGAKSARRH